MVLLRHEKRKVGRIHDIGQCTSIRVVSTPLGKRQFVAVGLARFDQLLQILRRIGSSRKSHQIPVLQPPIPGLIRTESILVKERLVRGGKVRKRRWRNAQPHHLGVPQRSVVGDPFPVVVAHFAIERTFCSSRVARAGGEFGIGAVEEAALGFDKFVLYMPETTTPKVDLDLSIVVIGVGGGRGRCRKGSSGGNCEENITTKVAA
mmetsp:Transcript_1811/g.3274  ORF Transcript_1811/g.3274 Transcript_1811/m.3274 type:complete len:205 (+) Transcript_1811:314-928(+)